MSNYQRGVNCQEEIVLGYVFFFIKKLGSMEVQIFGGYLPMLSILRLVMFLAILDEEIVAALNKNTISPLGGTIQMCVDQKGNKY